MWRSGCRSSAPADATGALRYLRLMTRGRRRLNVALDPEYAAKLALLAKQARVTEEALARLLLSQAIDEADVDAGQMMKLLDGIPNAFRRAQLGLGQARSGQTARLDEL